MSATASAYCENRPQIGLTRLTMAAFSGASSVEPIFSAQPAWVRVPFSRGAAPGSITRACRCRAANPAIRWRCHLGWR